MKTQVKTTRELWKQEAEDWLNEARKTARDLLLKRQTCTIEDVLQVCPRPSYLHRNLTGSVFKDDIFRPVGYTKSRRRLEKASVIRIWELKEEYWPQDMLAHRKRNMEDYENE